MSTPELTLEAISTSDPASHPSPPGQASKGMQIPVNKRGLSIRTKLLILLITLPLFTLGLYLFLAVTLFQSDKIAYVFASESNHAKTLAAQVGAEIQTYLAEMKPIVTGYEPASGRFNHTTENLFQTQDKIQRVALLKRPSSAPVFTPYANLTLDSRFDSPFDSGANQAFEVAKRHGVAMRTIPSSDQSEPRVQFIQFSEAPSSAGGPGVELIALAEFKSNELRAAFDPESKSTSSGTLLVDDEGNFPLGTNQHFSPKAFLDSKLFQTLKSDNFLEGVQEIELPDQHGYGLTAVAPVGIGGLHVVTWLSKEKALEASRSLVEKSVLFFIALLSLGTLVSFVASRRLTKALSDLSDATEKMAHGDFQVRVTTPARDEVGVLAKGFNHMAEEVSRLMVENVRRARMEKELETAQMVQKQFFPSEKFLKAGLRIEGASHSASECGGDFYQYTDIGTDQVILIFGDVTGHGVPAALLTATVHGIFLAVTDQFRSHSSQASAHPGAESLLSTLALAINQGVYASSKGEASFPCVLALVDLRKKSLSLKNFGHPAPYAWDPVEKKWTFFSSKRSNPLGAEPFSDIEPKHVLLPDSSEFMLFFYTDGLFDSRLADDQKIDKRQLLEKLSQLYQSTPERPLFTAAMEDAIRFFGQDQSNYPDDITLVELRFKPDGNGRGQ